MNTAQAPNNQIAIFRGKTVRKTIYNKEWWFSVVDVCGALTDSSDAGAYWRKLKQRLIEEESEVVTFCHGLKLVTSIFFHYRRRCKKSFYSKLTL